MLDNERNCYWRTKGALAPAGQTKSAFLLVVGTPAGVTNKIKDLQWISEVESSQKLLKGGHGGGKPKRQGRIFSEIFPERKIVIRSDNPIESEADGTNLSNCRIELVGKYFDSFGIPEYSGGREFTWGDFLARMDPTAVGAWRESIRLLVSSVLQGRR